MQLFNRYIKLVMLAGLLFTTSSLYAKPDVVALNQQPPRQNLLALRQEVAEFLTTQTVGYPGNVGVNVGLIDPNLRLTKCHDLEVFLPKGSRVWGRTSVGARCHTPSAWTIYTQATVSVSSAYLVASKPLAQGRTITRDDLMFETGDITQLPSGIYTDVSQALGRVVNISMQAGTVLRQEMLKQAPVVQQGQTVMVVSSGRGFSVSAEGKAITKANEGQVVQVKVANGQVVSGIARQGGQVEIVF
ncbi:MAG: flagellar basal body P-ring formation protein FlgA [Betaproteobacteria bacterium HGW-Betaproteobacteria-22]|nr:MAG: flagellar basal body P-ring formation protein FlgA [Betaproteobacteria bacterium HGW-Betaproteobacteria-22]